MKLSLTITISMMAFMFCTSVSAKQNEYDIGQHRKIYMECKGRGEPVVILIAGYKERGDYSFDTLDTSQNTDTVFAGVSKFTTVCLYDRPGTIIIKDDDFAMSRSTPVSQPVTVNDQVNDLAALIKAANFRKPLVIVAHSAGGMIARMYAFKYPRHVAGMILLDVTTEDLKDKWDRQEWTLFDYSNDILLDEKLYAHKELEWLDINVSFYQIQSALGKGQKRIKLKIPHVTVISADKKANVKDLVASGMWPAWATQEIADDVLEKVFLSQRELPQAFSPTAKHIANPNSGHNIQKEQPQLVIDEIRQMVTAIRQ